MITVAGFTPTSAKAVLRGRLPKQKNDFNVVINSIVDAVKLYNDLWYRMETDKVARSWPISARTA